MEEVLLKDLKHEVNQLIQAKMAELKGKVAVNHEDFDEDDLDDYLWDTVYPDACDTVLAAVYNALMEYYPVDTLMNKEQRKVFEK